MIIFSLFSYHSRRRFGKNGTNRFFRKTIGIRDVADDEAVIRPNKLPKYVEFFNVLLDINRKSEYISKIVFLSANQIILNKTRDCVGNSVYSVFQK